MTIYEIVNPSDRYTMEAPDLCVAAVANLLLGKGQYALADESGEQSMPLMIFGDPDDWFLENLEIDGQPATLESALEHVTSERGDELAATLESVTIGDREAFLQAVAEAPEGTREEVKLKLHDRERSSMNDIGRAAWGIATRLREQAS